MASDTISTDTSTRATISYYKDYYENLDLQTLGVDSTQVLKAFAVDATGAGTPRDQVGIAR